MRRTTQIEDYNGHLVDKTSFETNNTKGTVIDSSAPSPDYEAVVNERTSESDTKASQIIEEATENVKAESPPQNDSRVTDGSAGQIMDDKSEEGYNHQPTTMSGSETDRKSSSTDPPNAMGTADTIGTHRDGTTEEKMIPLVNETSVK